MSQDRIDVTELPKSQLRKSSTYLKYADEFGLCTRCGEHAEVLNPCCGRLVSFEGEFTDFEKLWNQIESELSEQAEAQIYDQEIE